MYAMTRDQPARPRRVFGSLLESYERIEQEPDSPRFVESAGVAALFVLVIGPLMLLMAPPWLAAYYVLVVVCGLALRWLEGKSLPFLSYSVIFFGLLSALTYMSQLSDREMHVWKPGRIKWFVIVATASMVIAIWRRVLRSRRDPAIPPIPGGNAGGVG